MIHHVVFFRLLDTAEGKSKTENARIIKEGLEGLSGKIEGLTKFGRSWAIPKDTKKPTDNRVKSGAYKDWRKKYTKDIEE